MKVAVNGTVGLISANIIEGLNALGIDNVITVGGLAHRDGSKH